MGHILSDITETVGSTPLVDSDTFLPTGGARIVAKLESFNPLSSVKDRIGVNMIEAAEEAGGITPGRDHLVEPTSGNTGIGSGLCGGGQGLPADPDHARHDERRAAQLLQLLGAEVVLTPGTEGHEGCHRRGRAAGGRDPGAVMLQQFENPANPDIHRRTTAEEIWDDTDGEVDIVVAGVGTGGTITGIGQALKERKPVVQMIAVEPADSPVLSGGEPGPHKIQGIGAGFVPDVLDRTSSTRSSGEPSRTHSRPPADSPGRGHPGGISSGAAVHAALEVAVRPENAGKLIVVILPDTGERYLSTALAQTDRDEVGP